MEGNDTDIKLQAETNYKYFRNKKISYGKSYSEKTFTLLSAFKRLLIFAIASETASSPATINLVNADFRYDLTPIPPSCSLTLKSFLDSSLPTNS
jgi:hypothetical protein